MPVEFVLKHDEGKQLKGGKRRYVDEDGHNIYLTGEEVEKLGAADLIKVTLEAV